MPLFKDEDIRVRSVTVDAISYASSGATPMQFAIHVKLEYLG